MPYRPAFPSKNYKIRWCLYEESTGACLVQEFFDGCEEHERTKIIARMEQWAEQGNWNSTVGFVKRLDVAHLTTETIYEVKSHQERILFIRCCNDAIAIAATKKKNDWSKKDNDFLKAACLVAEAARKECPCKGR